MKTSIETLKQISVKRYLAEKGINPAKEYTTYGMYKSPFLSKHSQIYAYLDNDEGGKSAIQKLKKSGLPVTDCSKLYADDKDLNDFLKRMIKQKPAQNITKFRRIKF